MLTFKKFAICLSMIVIIRLLLMYFVPFIDPTEPRYAEIARIMYETGDWITPYFDYHIPFWGKPPLSFWVQAFSIYIFGSSELAIRLPSLIVTLFTAWLIFHATLLIEKKNIETAFYASLIFLSSLLVFVVSGAVLTDPFMALGTCLSMVSLLFYIKYTNSAQSSSRWAYLYFVGLCIGALAKGPVAILLIIGSSLLSLIFLKKKSLTIAQFPFFKGALLVLLIALPWYLLAEYKTPGFLNYFIVGEHINRFLVSGWKGDLYGTAHRHMIGMIWVYWLISIMPWTVIILVMTFSSYGNGEGMHLRKILAREELGYLFSWLIFPLIIFTFARNILWTYVLPTIPPFSIMLGICITRTNVGQQIRSQKIAKASIVVTPLALSLLFIYSLHNPRVIGTEKYFIKDMVSLNLNKPVFLIGSVPSSARFYLRGKIKHMDVKHLISSTKNLNQFYVIMPSKSHGDISDDSNARSTILLKDNLIQLVEIDKYTKYNFLF